MEEGARTCSGTLGSRMQPATTEVVRVSSVPPVDGRTITHAPLGPRCTRHVTHATGTEKRAHLPPSAVAPTLRAVHPGCGGIITRPHLVLPRTHPPSLAAVNSWHVSYMASLISDLRRGITATMTRPRTAAPPSPLLRSVAKKPLGPYRGLPGGGAATHERGTPVSNRFTVFLPLTRKQRPDLTPFPQPPPPSQDEAGRAFAIGCLWLFGASGLDMVGGALPVNLEP